MQQDHLRALTAKLRNTNLDEVPSKEPQVNVMYAKNNGVAELSLVGVMTRYPTKYDEYFGFVPVEPIVAAINRANADPEVYSIQINIDSPGGMSDAGAALAEAVMASKTRVVSFVDGMAASASYRVAAVSKSIRATRSSRIGSIGTYAVLVDDEKFWDEMGVKWHLVSTGRFKGLGADGKVTQDLLDDVQREVNDLQAQFRADVSNGRRMTMDQVIALADGRVWIANEAMNNGLIDGVASRDAATKAIHEETYEMTLDQFNAFAAEHPEAVAGWIEQGKNAGIADGRKEVLERLAANIAASKGRLQTAIEATLLGQGADTVSLAVAAAERDAAEAKAAAEKAADEARAKDAEIAKLRAQIGEQSAVGTAAATAAVAEAQDKPAFEAIADPVERAKAEWAANLKGCQDGYPSEDVYIRTRKRQLR